jgi:hypothetical protein
MSERERMRRGCRNFGLARFRLEAESDRRRRPTTMENPRGGARGGVRCDGGGRRRPDLGFDGGWGIPRHRM